MFDHRMSNRAPLENAPIVFDRRSGEAIGKLSNVSPEGIQLICDDDPGCVGLHELEIRLPQMICGITELRVDAEMVWSDLDTTSTKYACGFRLRHVSKAESEVLEQLTRESLE